MDTLSIIGAGIGGLTTALVLKERGFDATIYESAEAIKPVGGGIMMANNAMQIFKKLGIHNKIESAGNKISFLNITNSQLNSISKVDLTEYEKEYGVSNIAIHRGELQKILADELGYDKIKLSKKLSGIEKGSPFKLTFEDQTTIESKIVIGADGIKSVVRNQLFEKSILRDANQICWRGICEIDLPSKYHNELNEAWGKGKRFGFVKISDSKVYWFALTNSKNINAKEVVLTEMFSDFHPDILEIIAATNKEQIIINSIFDLKPIKKWYDENICLIGDAAHATTPNLGQGACQAVEDAYTLGKLIDSGLTIEGCFEEYQNVRQKKVNTVVSTSWKIGKMAQLENSFAIWTRNIMMRNFPKSANKKQIDKLFNLD